MRANYHTHTPRCNHATGEEWEYAAAAAAGGLEILGFSDHSPYLFDGYDSHIRMTPEETAGYVSAVRALQEEYCGRMEVALGFELEFYPKYFDRTVDFLRDHGADYFILGQHFLDNEENAVYCGRPTEDRSVLDRYCGQCMDALQSGLYTYFAHPDLIYYTGDAAVYEIAVRRLCRCAVDFGVPLEINLLGFRDNRNYPDERFWRVAGEEGAYVVLGCDSHSVDVTLDPESEKKALQLVAHYGLNLLETVNLIRP